MTIRSQEEVRQHAISLGVPQKDAKILSAIACAESPAAGHPGFCTIDALGDLDKVGESTGFGKTWGPSYSEFQIRTIQEETDRGTYRDIDWLKMSMDHPIRAAWAIAQTTGYESWTTYRTGAYLAYMQDVIPPKPGTYIVMAGDTLSKIGDKLFLDWEDLARLNNMSYPYRLSIGQVLKLPYVEYVVVKGDTLIGIARKMEQYGIRTEYLKIASYNKIPPPYTIMPGQKLRIYRS